MPKYEALVKSDRDKQRVFKCQCGNLIAFIAGGHILEVRLECEACQSLIKLNKTEVETLE